MTAASAPTPVVSDRDRAATSGLARRLGSWRLAARLARREVRRRPGRTALVALLVAAPVGGITVADVLMRTSLGNAATEYRAYYGASDLTVGVGGAGPNATLRSLPEGSRVIEHRYANLPLTPRESGRATLAVQVSDIRLDDPLSDGMVDLRAGRWPTADGEVFLSDTLATYFDVEVGEVLELARPASSYLVTGIGHVRRCCLEFAAPGFDWSVIKNRRLTGISENGEGLSGYALVDLPPGVNAERWAAAWRSQEDLLVTPSNFGTHAGQTLVAGWVAEVLALAVLGTIIAAAFAAGARRQLVTLGQLSAGGADQSTVRRMLALQGSWCAALGVVIGMTVAAAALYSAKQGWTWPPDDDPYLIVWGDLVGIAVTAVGMGTLAALVPARTAAKVPVMAALAGRRPLGRIPRRLVPIGLALFGGGLGLLAISVIGARSASSAGNDSFVFQLLGVVGGLGVLFGTCCISPLVVSMLGPIGERMGGTGRLAARSMARLRGRHAAVVTAIAAIGAATIAASTLILSSDKGERRFDNAPVLHNSIKLDAQLDFPAEQSPQGPVYRTERTAVPGGATDELSKLIPGVRWFDDLVVELDPGTVEGGWSSVPDGPVSRDEGGGPVVEVTSGKLMIATEATLAYAGVSERDRRSLEQLGALVARPTLEVSAGTTVTLRLGTMSGDFEIPAATRHDEVFYGGSVIITPSTARALGLDIVEDGKIGLLDAPLDDRQHDAVEAALQVFNTTDPYSAPTDQPALHVYATHQYGRSQPSFWTPRRVQVAVIGGALLLTLIVVAISLALSAAESREERDVLVALGARPGALSQVAGLKALLTSVTGAALAIPAGFLAMATTIRASRTTTVGTIYLDRGPDHLVFPWLAALALLVGVPLAAALVAGVGSSITRAFRPLRMSTLHLDR